MIAPSGRRKPSQSQYSPLRSILPTRRWGLPSNGTNSQGWPHRGLGGASRGITHSRLGGGAGTRPGGHCLGCGGMGTHCTASVGCGAPGAAMAGGAGCMPGGHDAFAPCVRNATLIFGAGSGFGFGGNSGLMCGPTSKLSRRNSRSTRVSRSDLVNISVRPTPKPKSARYCAPSASVPATGGDTSTLLTNSASSSTGPQDGICKIAWAKIHRCSPKGTR